MTIYADHILDHYHNPRHRGTLPDATHTSAGLNASCGDQLSFALRVTDATVAAVCWQGAGCAISQAAASLLADYITGKSVTVLATMDKDAMLQLLAIPLSAARIQCGLLALETAQKALRDGV